LRTGEPPADAVPVPDISGAFVLSNTSAVPDNISIQDGASVAVGLALDPQPGDRILDLAAAPGGKTLHIADRLGSVGLVVASDQNPRRVAGARRRLAGSPVRWCVADGRRVPFPAACFDRVLLDAPCSGIGTLRRRPEIRFRVSAARIDQLSLLQAEMLEEAMRVVKPGGTVVYSVCTVTPQETLNVIDQLPTEPIAGLPGRAWGSGWLLGPHLTGTDGMFITKIRG
jgi:16S rRNA (cytosine967-C5)-methyltransferase